LLPRFGAARQQGDDTAPTVNAKQSAIYDKASTATNRRLNMKARDLTTSMQIALDETCKQIRMRGCTPAIQPRYSQEGDIHVYRNGKSVCRLEVKGMEVENNVFLKKRQVDATQGVVLYICEGPQVWVFDKWQAYALLKTYATRPTRKGTPPAAEGCNYADLPPPTGWGPLNAILR
jgi:hypothetical protein